MIFMWPTSLRRPWRWGHSHSPGDVRVSLSPVCGISLWRGAFLASDTNHDVETLISPGVLSSGIVIHLLSSFIHTCNNLGQGGCGIWQAQFQSPEPPHLGCLTYIDPTKHQFPHLQNESSAYLGQLLWVLEIALWPWPSFLTFFSFSFYICKMRLSPLLQSCCVYILF